MIKNIYLKNKKNIAYGYNLTQEDYDLLSEKLELNAEKIKDMINEEIFTPRISKSEWEVYKLYYPEIKLCGKENKFSWSEISPIIILKKQNKILIISEKYFDSFYDFFIQYTELHYDNLDENRFILNILHTISQNLYKYVRFLIGEHGQIETVLRERQSNEKIISLAEVEQGFYTYNIALRNLNYVMENINEDLEFSKFEEYMTKILQEINFTMDLSSSYCEICRTTRETYSSYISNNMNVTMKILAAVTILITVPNMIFGFYGMNVLLPLQDRGFFALAIIIAIMIALMIALWKFMKKKIL